MTLQHLTLCAFLVVDFHILPSSITRNYCSTQLLSKSNTFVFSYSIKLSLLRVLLCINCLILRVGSERMQPNSQDVVTSVILFCLTANAEFYNICLNFIQV